MATGKRQIRWWVENFQHTMRSQRRASPREDAAGVRNVIIPWLLQFSGQRHQHTGEDDRLWVTRAALKSSAQRKGLGYYFIAVPLMSHHKNKFKQKPKTLSCYSRKETEWILQIWGAEVVTLSAIFHSFFLHYIKSATTLLVSTAKPCPGMGDNLAYSLRRAWLYETVEDLTQ